MSFTASLPSIRGRCVEHTDYAFCLCSRFVPARNESRHLDGVFPVLIASQMHLCTCGHAAHAHVDYLSQVVHHCPATRCAAYAQKVLPSSSPITKPSLIQFILDASDAGLHVRSPPCRPCWYRESTPSTWGYPLRAGILRGRPEHWHPFQCRRGQRVQQHESCAILSASRSLSFSQPLSVGDSAGYHPA